MNGKNIAYKRCSSIDQNIERQTEILKKYNIDKESLSLYNNLEEIKPGMKLIIPNKNE